MDLKRTTIIFKQLGETLLLILIVISSMGDCSPQLLTRNTNLPQRLRGNEYSAKCRECSSAEEYRPICGSDSRTYANECELERINCEGFNVQQRHDGKCSAAATTQGRCSVQRAEAEKKLKLINSKVHGGDVVHVPQCQKDGTFNEVQCHSNADYCWCVNPISGQPIPGSSTLRWRRPKCTNANNQLQTRDANTRRGSMSKKRPVRQECRKSEQTTFNQNLVKLMVSEYQSSGGNSRIAGETQPLERRAVEWKFSVLDKNRNNWLEKKEVKTLKRLVRKMVKPSECAKAFTKNCDTDKNRKISQGEWVACLGGGMNKEQTDLPRPVRPQMVPTLQPAGEPRSTWNLDTEPGPTVFEEDELLDCPTERQNALEMQITSQTTHYVPECDLDRKYSQIQCYKSTGYCWCVDRETGKTIPNTSVRDVKPDCDKLIKAHKQIKGCPSDKKQQFSKEFIDYLINDMKSSSNHTIGALTTHDSQLDAVLDKNEWRELRKELRKKKSVRKCGRNFIKLCDANNDKKIAYDEWIECFSIFKEPKTNIPTRRQKGQNPLDKYLKND